MKAIVQTGNGQARDVLEERELPMPEAGPGDLLVRIQACAMNPVDTKFRAGRPLPESGFRVLGWDACGQVEALGEGVTGFAVGDQVYYAGQTDRHGCNAEYQAVDARLVAKAPASLNPAEAAALPLTGLTAWEALFERLGYEPDARELNATKPLLIINGAGGVGSIALQLCRWAGIPVAATASRPESQAWCWQMGATEVIDRAALVDLPDNRFARILCCHDTDAYFDLMSRLVAPQGLICALAGTREKHDLQPLMNKSAGFIWEYMFTRSQHQTADIARQGDILTELARLVEAGEVKTTLTDTTTGLTAGNIAALHERQEAGGLIGKQVVIQ